MGERAAPLARDTTTYLLDALDAGKKLLMEGAQGACSTSTMVLSFRDQQQQLGGRLSRAALEYLDDGSNMFSGSSRHTRRGGWWAFPTELSDETETRSANLVENTEQRLVDRGDADGSMRSQFGIRRDSAVCTGSR